MRSILKSAIEWHDSELADFKLEPNGLATLTLDAYVHRTGEEPGMSPGEGGIQRVQVLLEFQSSSGQVGALPAVISNGALIVGNRVLELVPLPFLGSDSCELRLTFLEDGREFLVKGRNVSVQASGEFSFVEHVDFS